MPVCFPIFVPDPVPGWYPNIPLPTDPQQCISWCQRMGDKCLENAKRWYDQWDKMLSSLCDKGLIGGFAACMGICTGATVGIGVVGCLALCGALTVYGLLICLQLRDQIDNLYNRLVDYCEQKERNCIERCPCPKPGSIGKCKSQTQIVDRCELERVY